jgi:glutathione S-transferase
MRLMGIPFTHRAVSVFRHLAEFQAINPVVKAPTLILDDGSTLMDSTLILDYLDTLHPERSLMPKTLPQRQRCLYLLGLALAAMEKSVQLVYEQQLRPEDKRHLPWQERVASQLTAAHRVGTGDGKIAARYQQGGSGRYQHCRRLALQP